MARAVFVSEATARSFPLCGGRAVRGAFFCLLFLPGSCPGCRSARKRRSDLPDVRGGASGRRVHRRGILRTFREGPRVGRRYPPARGVASRHPRGTGVPARKDRCSSSSQWDRAHHAALPLTDPLHGHGAGQRGPSPPTLPMDLAGYRSPGGYPCPSPRHRTTGSSPHASPLTPRSSQGYVRGELPTSRRS
jgi:hypothetical protein